MIWFMFLFSVNVSEYNFCLEMVSLNQEIKSHVKKVKKLVLICTNFLFSDNKMRCNGEITNQDNFENETDYIKLYMPKLY